MGRLLLFNRQGFSIRIPRAPKVSWFYLITTGELLSSDGKCWGVGYSGNGAGENNPAYECLKDVGPIPEGTYTIGDPVDDPKLGLLPLPLAPYPGNQMYGRSGFFIHGDSIEHPGHASDGCIIQPHAARQAVVSSSDRVLEVVRSLEDVNA